MITIFSLHVYALMERTLLEGMKNGSSRVEEPFFAPSCLLLRFRVEAAFIFMQNLHNDHDFWKKLFIYETLTKLLEKPLYKGVSASEVSF